MSEIVTSIWFGEVVEEAVDFYVGLFPDSSIDSVTRAAAEGPGGPVGTILGIDFTLMGRRFNAINGQRRLEFTDAVTLSITTETQEEADRNWAALSDGGEEIMCGWCQDRFGFRWQICPQAALDLMSHADPDVARKATEAMYGMKRIDAAEMARTAGA